MKFSLWTDYGALNSREVFNSFAYGIRSLGYDIGWNDDVSDVDVIWSVLWRGRMAPNKSIWQRNMEQSKPTIVLEVGGIKRGTTWKVGLNGINRDAYFGPMANSSDRANLLGLVLKPWQALSEKPIAICCQNPHSQQWANMPPMSTWVMDTIDNIRKHSNRHIVVRPHPRAQLYHIEHEWKNVSREIPEKFRETYDDYDFNPTKYHAVVNWSSNPATQAVIAGVPAFVGPSSLAYDVADDIDFLEKIENPHMPDRQQWLNDIAYTEWTVEEISQGLPLKRLTNIL